MEELRADYGCTMFSKNEVSRIKGCVQTGKNQTSQSFPSSKDGNYGCQSRHENISRFDGKDSDIRFNTDIRGRKVQLINTTRVVRRKLSLYEHLFHAFIIDINGFTKA